MPWLKKDGTPDMDRLERFKRTMDERRAAGQPLGRSKGRPRKSHSTSKSAIASRKYREGKQSTLVTNTVRNDYWIVRAAVDYLEKIKTSPDVVLRALNTVHRLNGVQ